MVRIEPGMRSVERADLKATTGVGNLVYFGSGGNFSKNAWRRRRRRLFRSSPQALLEYALADALASA